MSTAPTIMSRLMRSAERLFMGRRAYKWVVRNWLALDDMRAASEVLGTMRFSRQIEPQVMTGPHHDRIFVLAPHPDDEVIGPGGTLIRAARAGKKVTVLFLTSGASRDAAVRRNEAMACCAANGFASEFLDQAAGHIDLEKAAAAVAGTIARLKPGALFLPFVLDDHDDHRRANEVLLRAFSGHGGGPEIWAYQVYTPLPGNVVVDISDVIDAKCDAIRTYRSQMQRRDWAHFARGLNAFNCRMLPGDASQSYAECFFVVPCRDYLNICRHYFAPATVSYETAHAQK